MLSYFVTYLCVTDRRTDRQTSCDSIVRATHMHIVVNKLTVAMDNELIRRTCSEFLRKLSLNSRMSLRVQSTAGISAGSSVTHVHKSHGTAGMSAGSSVTHVHKCSVLSNIKPPPAFQGKAATDKLVEKIVKHHIWPIQPDILQPPLL